MKARFLIPFLLLVAVVGTAACSSTIVPQPVVATQASWDGGQQNSGVIAVADGYIIVTATARARYNALIETYGKEFSPALVKDYGVTADGENFKVTSEAVQKWALMNAWKKSGRVSAK
jgi:hypothetical protein